MTQPTLNRRGFLGALIALATAPKALERIAAMTPRAPEPLWACSNTVVAGGRFSHITLQKAYRKMQGKLLEGFHLEPAEWDEFDAA